MKVLLLRLALDGAKVDRLDAAELEREISRVGLWDTLMRHGLTVQWSDARWETQP